jgi:hypothetical protein
MKNAEEANRMEGDLSIFSFANTSSSNAESENKTAIPNVTMAIYIIGVSRADSPMRLN